MAYAYRSQFLSLLPVILLAVIVPLADTSPSVIAASQDTGELDHVWTLQHAPANGAPASDWTSSAGGYGPHGLPLKAPVLPPQVAVVSATLVQVIDTSKFSPPSPDPTGIAYIPATGLLLVSDSEVNETSLYAGVNLFEMTLSGEVVGTGDTTAPSWLNAFSKASLLSEPTGLALDPDNGHLFVTDDQTGRIFDMMPGADTVYGTADDVITSVYKAQDVGSFDPEGVAFDSLNNTLYVADGPPGRVVKLTPGPNGFFDAPPPMGDDLVTKFDVERMGIFDPEGIAFNPESRTLYVVGRGQDVVLEISTRGVLVRVIDIAFLNAYGLSDIARAPGSMDPTVMNLYLTDRGVDNNSDPNENDGKIYEISLTSRIESPTPSPSDTPLHNTPIAYP